MSAESEAVVQERLARSRQALAAAETLADSGYWTDSVNRVYYACFYAVSALLFRHGLSSAKHSGVRGLFNREFVRPGAVPPELGRFYEASFTVDSAETTPTSSGSRKRTYVTGSERPRSLWTTSSAC